MERIRFFRNLRGMTQKWLGQAVGFPQKSTDIRMAQYESGSRTPKEDLVKSLAGVLEVSPLALRIPDIDSKLGFIHTLFAVEDLHGVRVKKTKTKYISSLTVISRMLTALFSECLLFGQSKLKNTEAARFPKSNMMNGVIPIPKKAITQRWTKVPSQELSNTLVEQFKDQLKTED